MPPTLGACAPVPAARCTPGHRASLARPHHVLTDWHGFYPRRAATKQELQDYLSRHKIEERLNGWLNEIAKERPEAPYAWLARRMRGEAPKATEQQSTQPALDSKVGAGALADVTRAWSYVLGYQGVSDGASAVASAPQEYIKAPELLLTIEPAPGSSLLLAIRPK